MLADQTELFNGYATPVPYDTVVLYAVTPSGSELGLRRLAALDLHARVHAHRPSRSIGRLGARRARHLRPHADSRSRTCSCRRGRSKGWRPTRRARSPAKGGFTRATSARSFGEGARQRRLEPLDRVNGGLTDWPGGAAVYAYGVGFHQYLADRFGATTLATLAEATARRVPYVASPAFKRVFGESLGDLWREYQASLVADLAAAPAVEPAITRLTRQGFSSAVRDSIAIRVRAARRHRVLRGQSRRLSGAVSRRPRRRRARGASTTRYLGSTTGIGRDEILFRSARADAKRRPLRRSLRLLAGRRPRPPVDLRRAPARSGSVARRPDDGVRAELPRPAGPRAGAIATGRRPHRPRCRPPGPPSRR